MLRKFASILAPGLSPYLVRRAKAAAASGHYRNAGLLYEEALRLRPARTRLHIQCGHMYKEAGEFASAEAHYLAALRKLPNDADLALQLGHFYKVVGRLGEAEVQYRRAGTLQPGWAQPVTEVEGLRRIGWLGRPGIDLAPPASPPDAAIDEASIIDDRAAELLQAEKVGRLIPKLVPRLPHELIASPHEHIEIIRLGQREAGFWGIRRTMRGISAVHGYCVSLSPISEVRVIVNGLAVHRGSPTGGYPLRLTRSTDSHRKYVFNIWLDFSQFAPGLHSIELRCIRLDGAAQSFHDDIVIAAPIDVAEYPDSDALLPIRTGDDRSIDAQIRTLPSMVRSARREVFPDGVRNILVMRTDQLGDMVASIPAMQRLRQVAPDARIVGLLTGANADLARTLGLFDEVIVVDFPDDRTERRRLMSLDGQEALRQRLLPYRFDIALDLAQSEVSRDLLPLSGARFIYGVGGQDWPWMTTEFVFNSHDRWSRMDIVPHSSKVLAMIEALGAILHTSAPIIRREELTRSMLEEFGIVPGERYAVLHMGARVEFSRWPHYPELAAMLLRDTDLKIVFMTEDPAVRETMPIELLASSRVLYLEYRLTFDQFDAFVSFATVLVGNDSGPKHLASLRGTSVVTLFTARINWQEWGQENVGSIISRKVPCQGCAIFHDGENCGQGFTCIVDIKPQEVFDTVVRYI